ncbi:MAG: glycoside hydrolase family 127 protein, partial [Kiritimatiellae bacterium]|nr:glycoside hydrolase family 127 protein [Kiritimatiellia bacterium]
YYADDRSLYVNLYSPSEAEMKVGPRTIRLRQETTYPSGDLVRITVEPDRPDAFALRLRIPHWCDDASVSVNDVPTRAVPAAGEFFAVHRTWRKGDVVELSLPMSVRAVAGRRRRLAVDNVLKSGVASGEADARRIARDSFLSFAMLSVESLKASSLVTPETVGRYFDFDVPPETMALFEKPGQPVILASAHLGNWELSGHVISFTKPLVAVARTLDNPYAQRFMQRRNPRRRIEIVPKHSKDRLALLRPLRTGKLLGLICDQHASGGGVTVPFFGRPAATVVSPARLHLATGAPIVFGVCFRVGEMKFLMKASEPLSHEPTGDREKDIREITLRIAQVTERFVRMHPEQYLWAHRRWR